MLDVEVKARTELQFVSEMLCFCQPSPLVGGSTPFIDGGACARFGLSITFDKPPRNPLPLFI